MRGVLTIIPVQGAVSSKELAAPVALKDLKDGIGGGYVEAVPSFKAYQGERCVAFCDEDGKRKQMPVNQRATLLWHAMRPEFIGRDVLVGPVVIITGDRELLEEL
ncbi:MAG TPA: DUF3846 domain-containing protein [Caulobacteraceae bacterium]|jgi:hypothetical protein